MGTLYFFEGLTFFAIGLSVWIISRYASQARLSQQVESIGLFGFFKSMDSWLLMFYQAAPQNIFVFQLHFFTLTAASLALIFFSASVLNSSPNIRERLRFGLFLLFIPFVLLVSYAIVSIFASPSSALTIEMWLHYLLYLPAGLLASAAYFQQWQRNYRREPMLLLASLTFLVNALLIGLLVPDASYGITQWLRLYNPTMMLEARIISALFMAVSVLGTLFLLEKQIFAHISQLDVSLRTNQREALAWLNGLSHINRQLADLRDPDEILAAIVQLGDRLLEVERLSLALGSAENLQIQHGSADHIPVPVLALLKESKSATFQEQQMAVAMVPLCLDEKLLGVLWAECSTRQFSEYDLSKLEHLADQIIITLEHASMTAQLQSMAVMEERSRIAREMHDSLAQVLAYLSLETQSILARLDQQEVDKAHAQLRQMRESIRAAQADVRESILSLRTVLTTEADPILVIKNYLTEFSIQTGIDVRFENRLVGKLALSPFADVQMIRIVQEALTNVRKHAQATHIQVTLAQDGHYLVIHIRDNGVGFSADLDKSYTFGLKTMAERAASVQGEVIVKSSLGDGTIVEIRLPTLGA